MYQHGRAAWAAWAAWAVREERTGWKAGDEARWGVREGLVTQERYEEKYQEKVTQRHSL